MTHLAAMLCLVAMTTACSWVNDDTDDCPYGFWLNLHYTYNIMDVEAAPEYIKDVSVYVYDTVGNYVTRIDATHTLLQANGHRVRVEGLPEGDYQFVLWSGLGSSEYAVAAGMHTLDQFRISLATQDDSCSDMLPDLFYGQLPLVHFDEAYAEHHVQMMKDNNEMACVVVPLDENVEMNPQDYTMKIVTANSTMNAYNSIADSRQTTYLPFRQDTVTIDDADYGRLHAMRFGISTLRLMADTDCRLILQKNDTGETVFSVSLPEYIGMIGSLHTNARQPLTVQEYLDRQDFYTIVFFLAGDNLDQLMQLQVNSWRLRAYSHVKL